MLPNYQKWIQRELWTLLEAAFIVGGHEPVEIPDGEHPNVALNRIRDPGTREQVKELYVQSKDARGKSLPIAEGTRTGEIRNKRVMPWTYLVWAKARGFSLSDELQSALANVLPEPSDPNAPPFRMDARPLEIPSDLLALPPNRIVSYIRTFGQSATLPHYMRARELINDLEKRIQRQREGLYTVEEAAHILADSLPGTNVADLLAEMLLAFRRGDLRIRHPSTQIRCDPNSTVRDFDNIVSTADVDSWLAREDVGYRFPVVGLTEPGVAEAPKLRPLARQRAQELQILAAIKELGLDPKCLPRRTPGKKWTKSDIRSGLKKEMSPGIFNKAWDRLRSQGDIADET